MNQKLDKELLETSGIGACIFCGQINSDSYDVKYESQEHANEYATFKCSCAKADHYTNRKLALKRAEEEIEDLFGEGSVEYGLVSIKEEIQSLLFIVATHVYDNIIKDTTINISSSAKVRIAKSAKGKLQFMRSSANVLKKEV